MILLKEDWSPLGVFLRPILKLINQSINQSIKGLTTFLVDLEVILQMLISASNHCPPPQFISPPSSNTLVLSVALFKIIQNSLGFWIPRCGFWILGRGFRILFQWNLDSGFQSFAGFRIPWAEFRILKLKFPDSNCKNFPDSEIWVTLHRARSLRVHLEHYRNKYVSITEEWN